MSDLKILADECVFRITTDLLKETGLCVILIQDIGLTGANDQIVLKKAQELNSVLITNDLDFADIRMYPPSKYKGIIVLRMIPRVDIIEKVHRVLSILIKKETQFTGKLFVVDWNKYRERRTP